MDRDAAYVPIDPEIDEALKSLPLDIGALFGALSDASLSTTRALIAQTAKRDLSDAVARTDHVIPGDPDLDVRVHRPAGGGKPPLPCLYWIHGGGLVLGDHRDDDARFDRWCQLFNLVGVSVGYRLAPETPYPGPLDDCHKGLAWVHDNAADLGVDPTRIGIGGASAGGGLAAAVALLARDRSALPIAFQLLIYPMLDDRQLTASSAWPDPVWPPVANSYGWTAYLGAAKGTASVPAYAAPARATDLHSLPPTLIMVGGVDGFSDEDIDYAQRLRHAGVAVDLRVYAGAPHGFDSLTPNTAAAMHAKRDVEDWLAAQVKQPTEK